MQDHPDYQWLLNTASGEHWRRIGTGRRAGVAVPLFSLFSKTSIGLGEIPDITLLIDWCRLTGLSLLQLLPLNDTGFSFTPYDAQSSFALDPMYLNLERLLGVNQEALQPGLARLRAAFPTGNQRVNYGVKQAKLTVLRQAFDQDPAENNGQFIAFKKKNRFWLEAYAAFKVGKARHAEKAWWEWSDDLKHPTPEARQSLLHGKPREYAFEEWLQWQLCEQFREVKKYAEDQGVLLMGDLPFLVSRDSADVWGNQDYFKLDLAAGAPPDMYFADGQKWGMPPYRWEALAANDYNYLREKLAYAENFYDLYRIDHFVGIFRIWTLPLASAENARQGAFDPPDEAEWEAHGARLLDVMLASTHMLPCAEDLGTVPPCSYRVIDKYGIVGTDIQRWQRDWNQSYDFTPPENYRPNAIAMISTHDMLDLRGWWAHEIGSIDEQVFRHKCQDRGLDADHLVAALFEKIPVGRLRWRPDLRNLDEFRQQLNRPDEQIGDFLNLFRETIDEKRKFWNYLGAKGTPPLEFTPRVGEKTLEKIGQTVSIFTIQLLQDWLAGDSVYAKRDATDCRINTPGTVSDRNWSIVIPVSLEVLPDLAANAVIRRVLKNSGRT